MPDVYHSEITDPDIHEPKGISDALSGRVYQADGSGSGNWRQPLVLIEYINERDSYITEYEVSDLSDYSRLYLRVLFAETTSSTEDIGFQLYSTSAAAYRTTNYSRGFFSDGSEDSFGTETNMCIYEESSDLFGVGFYVIDNFNSASYPTVMCGLGTRLNVNLISSSSVPTSASWNHDFTIYNVDEAHERIKFVRDDGGDFKLVATLWGLKG